MKKSGNIVSYSTEELKRMVARGEDRTDWTRVDAMTEAALEAAIAADPDWRDIPRDWYKDAVAVRRGGKRLISLRIDGDIVDWFRGQGRGYQTRINGVLRAYVRHAAKGKPGRKEKTRGRERIRAAG